MKNLHGKFFRIMKCKTSFRDIRYFWANIFWAGKALNTQANYKYKWNKSLSMFHNT